MEKTHCASPRCSIPPPTWPRRVTVSVVSSCARATSPGPSPCSNAAWRSARLYIPELWFPETAAALGCAYAFAGRTAEAVSLLEQAEQRSTALGTMSGQTRWMGYASEAYQLAGRVEEAVQLAGRTLALARDHKERGHEAYVLRLLGDIATWHKPPDIELAETHYQHALALAEVLGMRPLQAHGHRGLGTLYATTGQREQAHTALSTASEMYTSMEMTFWLPQTEAALAQVEGR